MADHFIRMSLCKFRMLCVAALLYMPRRGRAAALDRSRWSSRVHGKVTAGIGLLEATRGHQKRQNQGVTSVSQPVLETVVRRLLSKAATHTPASGHKH